MKTSVPKKKATKKTQGPNNDGKKQKIKENNMFQFNVTKKIKTIKNYLKVTFHIIIVILYNKIG